MPVKSISAAPRVTAIEAVVHTHLRRKCRRRPLLHFCILALLTCLTAPSCYAAKYKSGELIVKYRSLPSNFSPVNIKGSACIGAGGSVDGLHQKYKVSRVDRLFPGMRGSVRKAVSRISGRAENVPDMYSVCRIKIDPAADPEQVAAEFRSDPNVEYAEPNYIYSVAATTAPLDYYFPNQWYLMNASTEGGKTSYDPPVSTTGTGLDIGATVAWSITAGTSSVIVAVLDTGVQYTHPDLTSNIWANPGEALDGIDNDSNGLIDDIRGWDFGCGDNNPADDSSDPGHGTMVAGVIAAVGDTDNAANVGYSTYGVVGVAWRCKVMPLKVVDAAGVFSTDGIVGALCYAADKGARVINNSWGGTADSQAMDDAINYAVSIGVLVVCAAGNNADSTFFPAQLPQVLGVGAVDRNFRRSAFTNFGSWVDISAPGTAIYTPRVNSTFGYTDGTSFSCPITAGVAALVISSHPAWSASQVRAALCQTAVNVDALNPAEAGKLGWGVVNAGAALQADLSQVSGATLRTEGEKSLFIMNSGVGITVTFPESCFSQTATVSLTPRTSFPAATSSIATLTPSNIGFDITVAQGYQPQELVELTIEYTNAAIGSLAESQLVIARYDDSSRQWVPLPGTVYASLNKVTATTRHFSTYQLMQLDPAATVESVIAFPNPFKPYSGHTQVTFANMPAGSTLRIYTLAGELTREMTADAAGRATWDGLNHSGQTVASGVYFALASSGGSHKTIKIAVQR